jgi:ubiquinol-cytochrome c reductase cytochrome b/c1 subunit
MVNNFKNKRLVYLLAFVKNHLLTYPTFINVSYFWGFGSLAGLCLVIQLASGIFLAMHYTPHVDYAFYSVEHIMRDVNYGWLIRYAHANGASMFFLVVYVHIARGIYYSSFSWPRGPLWLSGVLIFVLMMATAFMGYVLPWGQMSFWGATVITNLFSAIPVVGPTTASWLWGGFSVDNPTLTRFFSLHYLLPFAITGLVIIHLVLLHQVGSSNPSSESTFIDGLRIPFFPYFYVKDLFGFLIFSLLFVFLVFYHPNLLGHPDNYIEANPMVTPAHIVPEWYFLPFYAMLRSVPDKLGGVLCMGLSIVVLFVLPLLIRYPLVPAKFRLVYTAFCGFLFGDTFFLGWLGGQPIHEIYINMGQLGTIFYFFFFLAIIPLLNRLEYSVK